MSFDYPPALTLDLDWAPDFIIDEVAGVLIERKVKATWFITHLSPAVERLRAAADLFELGLHPNFLPGSTHGRSPEEVLGHLRSLLPEAVSMRSHGLVQATGLLVKAASEYGVEVDSSLFLPGQSHLRPHLFHYQAARLWRVPFFWEDDCEMYAPRPAWGLNRELISRPGLKIFNFHPVFVALNAVDLKTVQDFRAALPPERWTRQSIAPLVRSGPGPRSTFLELTGLLEGRGTWIREFASWAEGGE